VLTSIEELPADTELDLDPAGGEAGVMDNGAMDHDDHDHDHGHDHSHEDDHGHNHDHGDHAGHAH
jgi:hypothetical protein